MNQVQGGEGKKVKAGESKSRATEIIKTTQGRIWQDKKNKKRERVRQKTSQGKER